MKPDIIEIFEALKKIMTVSGYETINARAVLDTALEYTGDFFTSSEITVNEAVINQQEYYEYDAVGNITGIYRLEENEKVYCCSSGRYRCRWSGNDQHFAGA